MNDSSNYLYMVWMINAELIFADLQKNVSVCLLYYGLVYFLFIPSNGILTCLFISVNLCLLGGLELL